MAKKKRKMIKKKHIARTIKQYAEFVNPGDVAIMTELTNRIINAKNYMYSRLAGIHSFLRLYDGNSIRDEWVKDKALGEQLKLPARHRNIVLTDVIANIKSLWSNTCNKIKDTARENENLTEDEKSYIRYVCAIPSLFRAILVRQTVIRPKKIETLLVRETYIHNLIRRYARRYRGSIPYTQKMIFQLDADMYDYVQENGVTYIEMMTHIPRKRIRLKCLDNNVYRKNIRVTFDGHRFTLAHAVQSKVNKVGTKKNEVGIDKGYKNMIVSSSGNHYGQGLNHLLSTETERLNAINQKRNPYYAMVRELESKGDFAKAQRIQINNLGKKKYNKKKNQYDELVKSYINHEINRFVQTEKPSKVAMEDLTFVSWTKQLPKHVKRKLVRWLKGYLEERLIFKLDMADILFIHVNPAYTSQECHVCGGLGERKTQEKFVCDTCGEMNADENASKVIQKRMNDKEITLYTPYKKVKAILEKRTKELLFS